MHYDIYIKVQFYFNLEMIKLKIKKQMGLKFIKIINLWIKLRFKQWL